MKCRGCGEDIYFVKSTRGKNIPVNGLEPDTYYLHLRDYGEPQMIVVVETGECIRGRIGKATDNGVTMVRGNESHFATCPHADEFRKTRP